MCIVSSGHRFLEKVSKSKGLITFTMYFLMVGFATIGIFGKTQYPSTFTPRWVTVCMISSGLCCILGLVTACLVTNKNVDSQTPSPGAQLSQMYNTQVSPVLTVSVLDMDVTTGRSTFLPLIGYPVNHDFNLQLLLPNRYGNAEQILGVHLPQNGETGPVQTVVQTRNPDGTSCEKTVLADLKRMEESKKNITDKDKKKVETPPPSYSSLEISVQCGASGAERSDKEKPPSYDTALCKLTVDTAVEPEGGGTVVEEGAVGGVAVRQKISEEEEV